jgi:exonuclease III
MIYVTFNIIGFLSLNVRGIRSFDKRKALFHWCMKDKADIIFLQETYSTPEVENVWKSQWRGELFLVTALNTAEVS